MHSPLMGFDLTPLLSTLIPLLIAVILAHIDPAIRSFFKPLVPCLMPFLGWSLGASLNLRTAFRAGLSGMVLLLFFYLLLTPLLLLFEKKVLKSDGVTAIALNSVPGLAISFPLMFGKVFPRLTPHMEVAAAQVAFAVILSSILAPIFARYISGSQRTRT